MSDSRIRNKMNNIKGLIFDYGGTLDTAGCHWGKLIWKAYQQEQMPVTWEQFKDAYVFAERTLGSNPIIQTSYTFRRMLDVKLRIEMERLCTQGAWDADENAFTQKHEALLNNLYQRVVATSKESVGVLTQLRQRYPMVLVSNFYGNMHTVLEEFGYADLFQDVVESAVVGIRKPDPRIFKLGVQTLALPAEEVVVVGDSFYKDILPAKKVGCKTVWFKGEGWNDQTYDETQTDCVITQLDQLLQLL